MAWTEPVTDRTAEDVAQRRKKGFCNAADLNRLEGNCGWLGKALAAEPQTREWMRGEFPTSGELERILGNIAALRAAYYTRSTTPATPEAPLNTWEKWNEAETILRDIHSLLEANGEAVPRAGERWIGEGIGVI